MAGRAIDCADRAPLPSQALAAPCGDFHLTQLLAGGTDTGPSLPVTLPVRPGGCDGGGEPPPPPPDGIHWVTRWRHLDHLGPLRLLTDESGWAVSGSQIDCYPFGTPMDCMPPKGLFTRHEKDAATGLDYMLARMHSASMGSFASMDPARGSAKKALPESWNRYAYVVNNPVKFMDVDGLEYTTVNEPFAEALKRIRGRNIKVANEVLDRFEKMKSNPAEGHVAKGVPWAGETADGDTVRIFKADGTKPTRAEIQASGAESLVPRAGESIPAKDRKTKKNVGIVAVYPDAQSLDPSGAGLSRDEYIEKEILHETVEMLGDGDEKADAVEQEYVDGIKRKHRSEDNDMLQKTRREENGGDGTPKDNL